MKHSTEKVPGYAYRICVRGHLDQQWSDWLYGFEIVYAAGSTTLTGRVPDQAALHGMLSKIRDLGLMLLNVEFLENENRPRPRRKKGRKK